MAAGDRPEDLGDDLRYGSDFEIEFPLRRHDGGFRWFLTGASPLRAADGSIVRWVGINTDVDEIRAAVTHERRESTSGLPSTR